jgi:hypothetical protein
MKKAVFWDITPCGSCKDRRFGEMYRLYHQVDNRRVVTANIVPELADSFTQMMKVVYSSETSVLTRTTRRHILEDGILHSHRRENLKSYKIGQYSQIKYVFL